jgi:hypothetical protein
MAASRRFRPAAALMLGLLGLTPSCTEGQLDAQHQAAALQILEQLAAAPAQVAHGGERLVEIFGTGDQAGQQLAHRERIQTDGQGGFALEPLNVLSGGGLDEFSYLSRQIARAGFNFRYRDLQIVSPQLVVQNYLITSYGTKTIVAGRNCVQLGLQRRALQGDPPDRRYVIDLDATSHLVLQFQEFAADGTLLARSVYESYTPGVPAGMVPRTLANQEQVLALGAELDVALGFPVQLPAHAPVGYEFQSCAKIVDAQGRAWAKLLYSDGIEELFLLLRHSPAPAAARLKALSSAQAGHGQGAGVGQPFGSSTSSSGKPAAAGLEPGHLGFYEEGSLRVIQGWIHDWQVIAVARVPLIELQLLVESALP